MVLVNAPVRIVPIDSAKSTACMHRGSDGRVSLMFHKFDQQYSVRHTYRQLVVLQRTVAGLTYHGCRVAILDAVQLPNDRILSIVSEVWSEPSFGR